MSARARARVRTIICIFSERQIAFAVACVCYVVRVHKWLALAGKRGRGGRTTSDDNETASCVSVPVKPGRMPLLMDSLMLNDESTVFMLAHTDNTYTHTNTHAHGFVGVTRSRVCRRVPINISNQKAFRLRQNLVWHVLV